MNMSLKRKVVICSSGNSLDLVVRKMSAESKKVDYPGLVVVLDDLGFLLGMVTDGDVRRAYAQDIDFSIPVSDIMIKEPITILSTVDESDMASEVIRKVQLNVRLQSGSVRHILIVDEYGILVNIVDFFEILQEKIGVVSNVAIFGMGYVGITLAVSLANRGHQVLGIDIDPVIIKQLNNYNPHVHEPGLDDMLQINLERGNIQFKTKLINSVPDIYVVAVGTPLDSDGKPGLDALREVLKTIQLFLKKGDQVILRSTVPVGTTREFVIPFLEKNSGLKAGLDFFVTFAPERTIEGNAMDELKSLPQIIGGFSIKCIKYGADFWSTLTPYVVRMSSLEAAELVKLANNTFRDLSFAFANELALVADRYNVDTFDLIKGANDGYPRNKIPLPSPGVGGYCLTKDPILFSSTVSGVRSDAVLGFAGRKINEMAANYPYEVIKKYSISRNIGIEDMSVLIMGIAFKGCPETTDIRGSVAIDLLTKLRGNVKNILGWDAVISNDVLEEIGFIVMPLLSDSINEADVILIMNNHPGNISSSFFDSHKKNRLIFDGWKQLDKYEIESIKENVYSTMGYMTQ